MIGQKDIITRFETLEQTGQYDTLLKEADARLNDNPDLQPLYYYKGNALRQKGDMQGALAAYRWAILLNPNDAHARTNYASTLFDLKDFVGALNAADAAILMEPQFPEPYLLCGTILSLLGFPEQAMYPYHHAYKLTNNMTLGAYTAELYSQQNEPSDAFHLLMQVLENNNNDALHLQMACMLCFFMQNGVDLKNVKGWTTEWANKYKNDLSTEGYQNIMQQNLRYSPLSVSNIAKAFNALSDTYDATEENDAITFITTLENALRTYYHDRHNLKVLDVGCGTGLAISPVREYIHQGRLTGIDISSGLLSVAQSRKIYHELYEAEAVEFLSAERQTYDVIVAANSLPYFADLDPAFAAFNKALSTNGMIFFSIKHNGLNDENQILYPPYNYIFSAHYISSVLKKNGFAIRSVMAIQEGSDETIHDRRHFYVVQKER